MLFRFLFAWVLLMSLPVAACERGSAEVLTYENRTDMVVGVYRKYADSDLLRLELTLQPREVKETVGAVGYAKLFFEGKDSSNRVIFSLTTTPAALKETGWRIVISVESLTPTPSPAPN